MEHGAGKEKDSEGAPLCQEIREFWVKTSAKMKACYLRKANALGYHHLLILECKWAGEISCSEVKDSSGTRKREGGYQDTGNSQDGPTQRTGKRHGPRVQGIWCQRSIQIITGHRAIWHSLLHLPFTAQDGKSSNCPLKGSTMWHIQVPRVQSPTLPFD